MYIRLLCLTTACLVFSGCASELRTAIRDYRDAAGQVEIGMEKEQVLSMLAPTQDMLQADQSRPPERYVDENGQLVEIYYFRSEVYHDDILTDDEFTPYVFRNGRLQAIGWAALGGPKTQAMPPYPRTRFNMGFGYGYHRW
jgi:hypothetical protein